MKFPKLLLIVAVLVLPALSLVAQTAAVPQQQKTITKKEFDAKDKKAKELLETATYRMNRTFEYFDGRGKQGTLVNRSIWEEVHPNKWRGVDEFNYPMPSKHEYISDGKYFYKKKNNGDWIKSIGGYTEWMESRESDHTTFRYSFFGNVDLNGKKVKKYEFEGLRLANPYSMTDMLKVSGIRRTTYWYEDAGRILRKIEVNSIDGSAEIYVETFDYVYDPKGLKIEAPIK